jgi:glycerol-3-phosphate acyltransferase PlsX
VHAKKDSSIAVGCRLVKQGQAQGFFSAGSTGACVAAATLIIGRVKGVTRPAIATLLPTPNGSAVFLDSGANADVQPQMLLQFAQMGAVYAREVLKVGQPRIGLLNIGAEASKGSALFQEAYALLNRHSGDASDVLVSDAGNTGIGDAEVTGVSDAGGAFANNTKGIFIGNVEGTQLLAGGHDVIVTDGFTGNVALKTIEGTAAGIFGGMKAIFSSSFKARLAAALLKDGLRTLKDSLNAEKVGGALLLGCNGAVVIGHGSANAAAIANGIQTTADIARARVPALIATSLRDQ